MSDSKKHASTAFSLPEEDGIKEAPIEQVEEDVKSSISDITPLDDEDEELLIDEGGDFFWLLQNVIWGTLKSIFIIVILVVIIWVIWGKKAPSQKDTPKQTPEIQQETPTQTEEKKSWFTSLKEKWKKDTSEEKTQKKEVIIPPEEVKENTSLPSTPNNAHTETPSSNITLIPAQEIAQWHIYLEEKRLFDMHATNTSGINWIRKAHNIYAIPLSQHIRGENEYERQKQLETFLAHINTLLKESYSTRTELYKAKLEFAQKAQQAQERFNAAQTGINNALTQANGSNIEQLVKQKSQASEDHTYNSTNEQINTWLIARIEQYDKSLRSVYEIIFANQAAIIKDVRVVNFPRDPFERVITPAQWREGK